MSLRIEKEIKLEPIVPWEDITCLLWHNGMLFTTVTSNYNTSTGCNGKVHVWDKDLRKIGEFQAHKYGIYHMCGGPGDTIYTCASDSTIFHWKCLSDDLSSSSQERFSFLSELKGHMEPPWKMQFFNGRLHSADELGEIRLWENDSYKGVLETYEEVWDMVVVPKFILTVRNLDVSITAVPMDGTRKACSVQNILPGRGPLFVSGNKILCLHRTAFDILIYSLNEAGNPLLTSLKGHCSLVNAFVGSEEVLFSGDYDGKIMIWDLINLKKCSELDLKQHGCINAMAFDPVQKVVYVAQEGKNLAKFVYC